MIKLIKCETTSNIKDAVMELNKILNQKEVLELIKCSRSTLWRWQKEGKFPSRRILAGGSRVGWLASDLNEWMQNLPCVVTISDSTQEAQ